MLFIASKPTHLLITFSERIIITTNNKLLLTTLSFIEEFISCPLQYTNPLSIHWSNTIKDNGNNSNKQEILILTKNSIELYTSNWLDSIQIKFLIALNQENIYSVKFDSKKEKWHLYGAISQYLPSSKFITCPIQIEEEATKRSLFLAEYQYFIRKKHIFQCNNDLNQIHLIQGSNHALEECRWKTTTNLKQIMQRESAKVIKGCETHQSHHLLCIENELCLIIDPLQEKVIASLKIQNVIALNNGLIVSLCSQNLSHIKIHQIKYSVEGLFTFVNLGSIEPHEGIYMGSLLKEHSLAMIYYEFKQLTVKNIKLVSSEENKSYAQSRKEKQQRKDELKNQQHHPYNQKNRTYSVQIIPENPRKYNKRPPPLILMHEGKNLMKVSSEMQEQGVVQSVSVEKKLNSSISCALKASINKYQNQLNNSYCEDHSFDHLEMGDKKQINSSNKSKYEDCDLIEEDHNEQDPNNNQPENQSLINFHQHSFTEQRIHISLDDSPQSQEIQINLSPKHSKQPKQPKQSKVQQPISIQNEFSQALKVETIQYDLSSPIQWRITEGRIIANNKESAKFQDSQFDMKESLTEFEIDLEAENQDFVEQILEKHQFSQHDDQIQTQTPIFNTLQFNSNPIVTIQPASRWGHFQNNWGSQNPSDLVENREKITYFIPENATSTPALLKEISKKKYCHLMAELYRKQPQKFDEYLHKFLSKIIEEEEARIFFAEHIRIFNPELTRDRLLRLYANLQNNEKNKKLMSRALSEFKLNEVPKICLPIKEQIIRIFDIVYPKVYIEDLLCPDIKLFEIILQGYFKSICSLNNLETSTLTIDYDRMQQEIIIEDQTIDLSHPRNLLNILLYLNEDFKFDLVTVFELYIQFTIKYGFADIICKMVNDTDVLEICEIKADVVENAVEQCIIDFLSNEKQLNLQYIDELVTTLLRGKKKKYYMMLCNTIDYFNVHDLMNGFAIHDILQLPNTHALYNLLTQIINQTQPQKLVTPNILQNCFRMLSFLQDSHSPKVKVYTLQLIKLIYCLSQKLFSHKFYKASLLCLAPLCSSSSSGFQRGHLVKLLIKYLNGKYLSRLCNLKALNINQLQQTFKQLFEENIGEDVLPELKSNSKSRLYTCSLKKFSQLFELAFGKEKTASNQQIKYLLWVDLQLAYECVQQQVIDCSAFGLFLKNISAYLLNTQSYLLFKQKYSPSLNSKISLPDSGDQIQENSDKTSFLEKQFLDQKIKVNELDFDISQDQFLIRSMQGLRKQSGMNDSKQKLFGSSNFTRIPRSNSEKKSEVCIETDPILKLLKIAVQKQVIIQILRELYKSSTREKFIKGLMIIDRERINILNYEPFKALHGINLHFQYQIILPFQFFIHSNIHDVFQIFKRQVKAEITINNFWIVLIITEILFNFNSLNNNISLAIGEIFIEKLIIYEQNDKNSEIISDILQKFPFSKIFLGKMQIKATQNQLCQTMKLFSFKQSEINS